VMIMRRRWLGVGGCGVELEKRGRLRLDGARWLMVGG